MPSTNYRIVFARMNADAQRLLSVARTQPLRAKLLQLLDVYAIMEQQYTTQELTIPVPHGAAIKAKRVHNQLLQSCADEGRAAFYAGSPRTDCPYNETGQSAQRNRWEGAWDNAQALSTQPPTQESNQ